jgi:methylaspartate ammonia-lyase
MTKEEVRELIRETVRETLLGLGVDVANPLETQKDFASLREHREMFASLRKKVFIAIAAAAAGLAAAVKTLLD